METVILTISSNAAYTIGTSGTATVNLYDDDMPATVVTVSAADATAKELGTNKGIFTIARSGQYGGCPGSELCHERDGNKRKRLYRPAGSVTIAAGASTATVTVTPIDDTIRSQRKL